MPSACACLHVLDFGRHPFRKALGGSFLGGSLLDLSSRYFKTPATWRIAGGELLRPMVPVFNHAAPRRCCAMLCLAALLYGRPARFRADRDDKAAGNVFSHGQSCPWRSQFNSSTADLFRSASSQPEESFGIWGRVSGSRQTASSRAACRGAQRDIRPPSSSASPFSFRQD